MNWALLPTYALTFAGAALHAQDVTGGIHGRVTVRGGSPSAVQVVVRGADLLGPRSVTTDSDGYFHVRALPPGGYRVRFARVGLGPITIEDVQVRLGRITALPITELEPSPVRLEELRVTAERSSIDATSAVAGATLSPDEYGFLPVDRDYKSIMWLVPNVVQSGRGDPFNVSGATGLENTYYVDGVNVTSELRAESGTSLPYNFIKAVEVKTGGYEAEYGKALGAVVNAVTYSGSNEFTASVFAFGTSSTLAATPREQPTLREHNSLTYDVGVRVGGPVIRDRMWFSAAYNPRVSRADREVATHGMHTDERTAHVFAGKLSWRVRESTVIEASLFGDPTSHRTVQPPPNAVTLSPQSATPYLRLVETGSVVATLRSSVTLRRFLIDVAVARSGGRDNQVGATPAAQTEPLFLDFGGNVVDGGIGIWSRSDLTRSTFRAKITASARRHTIVAGSEYEDVSADRELGNTGGYMLFPQPPSGFRAVTEGAPGRFHNRIPTVYAQDSWQLTEAVTVNAGLRWSAQTLTAASGRTGQRFPNEWQPRGGVVWRPHGSHRERLFVSAGRFYLQEPLNLSSLWFLDYPYIVAFYSSDPRVGNPQPDETQDYSTFEKDWAKNIPQLQVEHSDEFTIGYERLIANFKLSGRGVLRHLRSSFQWGFDPSNGTWYLGTPGKGDFTILPKPTRDYAALELTFEGTWPSFQQRSSYVLSRNHGNYPGLYNSDMGIANPGGIGTFVAPVHAINSTGLLPNDRTHVFKTSAVYHAPWRLVVGTDLSLQSGAPMNAFGRVTSGHLIFVEPRGSARRTPWLWDLNLRLSREFPAGSGHTRLLVDILHVGNPQRAVRLAEDKYLPPVGSGPPQRNASYRTPLSFQTPMMARVGVEIEY